MKFTLQNTKSKTYCLEAAINLSNYEPGEAAANRTFVKQSGMFSNSKQALLI